ncbi:hypothetical protein Ndes2526B_g04681 [Nannochloris sp. 'desiccata']|nr:hypothetical protein KSW81_000596 [Chlorella desiccata (nom. nud.)]KAH7615681.1 putative Ergosterol biosynthetic protein 28 [Chlorella desiccata (nom. nud.)]KAH7615729.1 putative Ergosterol biosynthetic protein 28 [Chlorella desiccata (nom. nud.)]KAH7620760.1 putative Ergosterol biosynthetic protein 28 [Chlorella desiccata (nom. nud.)]
MPSVTALRRWLVFVALLRLFSVVLGYVYPTKLQTNLYTEQPDEVSALQARTFATWTLTSCLLCLICARNPCIPAIYGATLGSFLIALLHFLLELFAFKTVGLKTAIQPMVVAGVSSLWMIAGWNYYTAFAPHAEPTMSEETVTVQPGNKDE